MTKTIQTKRTRIQVWQHPISQDCLVLKIEDFAPTETEDDWECEAASILINKDNAIELRDALNEIIDKL